MDRLNQQHGLWFEDIVRGKNNFLGMPRLDCPFDIPALYNREFNLDVSVKTVRELPNGKLAKIGLASAPRFAAIMVPYQLVVGVHQPVAGGKMVTRVLTFVMSKEFHQEILGGLNYQEMLHYEAVIKAHRPGLSGDVLAREYAMNNRTVLMNRHHNRPLVEIAYKINSENRRAQFEIDLAHLEPALVRVDTESYRGTPLPLFYRPGVQTRN